MPDFTTIQIHIDTCIRALQDEDGRTKTRELAIAVTNLQQAGMWIEEHERRHGGRQHHPHETRET